MKSVFHFTTILILLLLFTSLNAAEQFQIPEEFNYKTIKSSVPKDSRSFYKRAIKNLQNNQPEKAKQYFAFIQKQEKSFFAYWGIALCYWQMDDTVRTSNNFDKAYTLNDTLPPFLLNYADFALRVERKSELVQNLAVKAYRYSQSDDALLTLIHSSHEFGSSKSVLKKLKSLTEEFPKSANAWVFYASLLAELKKNDDAVKISKRASAFSEDPFQLKLLSIILSSNGNFVESANICEKISSIDRKSSHAYEAWGFLEFKQANYVNAAINYKKALDHDYKEQTLLMLAHIYHYYLNRPKSALYYCKSTLQINRNSVACYHLLSEIHRKKGDLKRALNYSEKHLDLSYGRAKSHYYHGKMLFEMKRYDESVKYLEKAVELNSRTQRYKLVLAKAYAHAGQMDKAEQVYKNFINEPLGDLWIEEKIQTESPLESK